MHIRLAILQIMIVPLLNPSVYAQQAGTIGTTSSTTVSRQVSESTTTITTNNLSQSLLINASGVTVTGAEQLITTTNQPYQLQTPNGLISTTLTTTEINPSVSMLPTTPGAEIQLAITNELPGIKSVSVTHGKVETINNTETFSVYSTPLGL